MFALRPDGIMCTNGTQARLCLHLSYFMQTWAQPLQLLLCLIHFYYQSFTFERDVITQRKCHHTFHVHLLSRQRDSRRCGTAKKREDLRGGRAGGGGRDGEQEDVQMKWVRGVRSGWKKLRKGWICGRLMSALRGHISYLFPELVSLREGHSN